MSVTVLAITNITQNLRAARVSNRNVRSPMILVLMAGNAHFADKLAHCKPSYYYSFPITRIMRVFTYPVAQFDTIIISM